MRRPLGVTNLFPSTRGGESAGNFSSDAVLLPVCQLTVRCFDVTQRATIAAWAAGGRFRRRQNGPTNWVALRGSSQLP
jgi:hypothetical protein